ncbi:MAG: TolC family protein [Geobacteraceae bacterium]
MRRYIVVLVLVLSFVDCAAAQEGVRQLTLKEAIKLAVEKNLDVRAELYNPAAAEAGIYKNRGIYNPLLNLLANYQNSNTLSANTFTTGGVSVSRLRSTNYNFGISQLIPTGGTVGAAFNNSWNHNNYDPTKAINNYFQSNVTLSFTQPLLKNFGRETTELAIDVAKFSKEGTLEQFRAKLQDIISQVESQYYQLFSLRKNLEVKKNSLQLAETVLNNTQGQVKAGVLPTMEILNAQFNVATQQKNLIDAERALKDQVDLLRLLLQLNDVTDIIPADTPFTDIYAVDEARAIKYALAERPDLKQQRIYLKTSDLQARVARNQTLPQLDFSASAAFTGLASDYNRDLDRVGSGRYPIWIAGLQLTYPLGNDSAKNDYTMSKLKVEQADIQIKSLEESISKDVRIAARAVSSGYKQLDVTARSRAYSEEVVRAYIKKQKVGLATTKDVMDVMNNLVTAQGDEIKAVADYNNAIVALWKATGELLAREGIILGEREANSLYDANK